MNPTDCHSTPSGASRHTGWEPPVQVNHSHASKPGENTICMPGQIAICNTSTHPLQVNAEALAPGLLAQRFPGRVAHYPVIHLQNSTDLR